MKVLVTGANGFVGKNLLVRLQEEKIKFSTFLRGDSGSDLAMKVNECDFIVHLAGTNRPKNEHDFIDGNANLTKKLADILQKNKLTTPIIYSSSIQATLNNPYGASKKIAEDALNALSITNGNLIYNYRLPNVFGKWCKPNYNSAVATFCYSIINDLPIKVDNPDTTVKLVYIDDVVSEFVDVIRRYKLTEKADNPQVYPSYEITVGDLVNQLTLFKESRSSGIIERVGTGLARALYSTYISYFNPSQFSYKLQKHEDSRGIFVEMLKTKDSGQFSFFSAHPGITRGGHYHHSKNEKFLVIRGQAKFGFRNIITDEYSELYTSEDELQIIETVPGWAHDITNVGDDEMFVMLWANEIFDHSKPDTFVALL